MDHPKTVRVEHDDFPNGVLINKDDFDEDIHTLHSTQSAEEVQAERKMTVAEMRAELAKRKIEVPEGAKKADLKALLEG